MGILFGGFDEFQTPRLPPPAIPLPYTIFTILSLVALVPPLVLGAFSRDSGHPVLVNLLVSFFLYLVASALVVFSQGGRLLDFPSFPLCLVQGSMMVAGTPSLKMTAATFIFFLYATLQTSKKWLTSFVLSRKGTWILLVLPWVVCILVFLLALIIGHRHPEKVFLRDLYCVVFVDGLAVIRFLGSLIFLIIALASAVAVSVVVFRKHGLERRRQEISPSPGASPLRLDLWILFEAWEIGAFFLTVALLLARAFRVHTSIPADMMASTGGMFLLLLGNQWGLYSSSSWKTMFNSIRSSINYLREDIADRRAPPTSRTLLPTDSGRTSQLGPAVSTSTLGLEHDEGPMVTSSILLSRQFDEEEGMSSQVFGDRSASELGKEEGGESIQMEGLEAAEGGKRKKKMKIKVETVAASELGAEPLPSGRRVYQ